MVPRTENAFVEKELTGGEGRGGFVSISITGFSESSVTLESHLTDEACTEASAHIRRATNVVGFAETELLKANSQSLTVAAQNFEEQCYDGSTRLSNAVDPASVLDRFVRLRRLR